MEALVHVPGTKAAGPEATDQAAAATESACQEASTREVESQAAESTEAVAPEAAAEEAEGQAATLSEGVGQEVAVEEAKAQAAAGTPLQRTGAKEAVAPGVAAEAAVGKPRAAGTPVLGTEPHFLRALEGLAALGFSRSRSVAGVRA